MEQMIDDPRAETMTDDEWLTLCAEYAGGVRL